MSFGAAFPLHEKVKDIKPAAPGSAGKENASSEKAGSGSSKSVSGEASSKANENSSNDSKSAQRAAKKAARAKRTMQDLKQAIGHNLVKKEELEKELAAAERSVSGNDAARKLVSLAAQVRGRVCVCVLFLPILSWHLSHVAAPPILSFHFKSPL